MLARTEQNLSRPAWLIIAIVGAIWVIFWRILPALRTKVVPGFPLVGVSEKDRTYVAAQKRFLTNARDVLAEGVARTKNGIFQVFTVDGPVLILPPKYISELKHHPDLPMTKRNFFEEWPAFKIVNSSGNYILADMINKKLTPALALTTAPVNDETQRAMKTIWPASEDWTPTKFIGNCMTSVSQVSSRIFLGAPLCRDPEWIQIAKDFTVNLVTARYAMSLSPWFLRPIVYLTLKPVRELSKTVNKARALIEPEITRRRKARAEALSRGEKIPKQLDSIQWFADLTNENFDFVSGQLMLSFVAIHTTSSTLYFLMLDLLEHPDLLQELREEVVATIQEDAGLQKTTLYKMKLLDSILKESQRVSMLSEVLVDRETDHDITFSDGAHIPANTRMIFPCTYMRSNEYYEDAKRFDGKRFLRMREEPGNINRHQFVTVAPEHTGFGYGSHACPGRFFASNEIKVMLIHLILKYDFKFKNGKRPAELRPSSASRVADPEAELLYRSRTPELDLDDMFIQD